MTRRPYDFPGDPELARAVAARAGVNGTWITAIDDPYLPIFYATTNLWEYLGRGLDKRWVSIGVCQTADTEDNLRLGRALGQAIAGADRKVVLIASGALSHTFWPLLSRKSGPPGQAHAAAAFPPGRAVLTRPGPARYSGIGAAAMPFAAGAGADPGPTG